jgi:hypothetical protein
VPTEKDGKLSTLIDPKTDAAFFVGEPYFKNASLKNIAPCGRDPRGTGRMATAAWDGISILYDELQHGLRGRHRSSSDRAGQPRR